MNLTTEQLEQIIKEELEMVLAEKEGKKDACYHKVRARYDVWPSAYASGALVKCRKVGAKNWGNKSKKNESLNEEEQSPLAKVKDAINKEGGAAGLDKIVELSGLSAKEVKDVIEKSDDIVVHEEGDVINKVGLEETKKKSDKDRMKCNSSRRIRKGEAGYGKKKFVVKACEGGTEKIIRYGDANMEIKKDSPARRKSFRARHNCKNPGSKLKARYWSCKKW